MKNKIKLLKRYRSFSNFNKNGLWIKENLNNGQRIISMQSIQENILKDITIYNFDNNYNLKNKIYSETANIDNNIWELEKVLIFKINDKNTEEIILEYLEINSIYTYEKITNLFKNFDTLSFVDLVFNNQQLINQGYNKLFLTQSLHAMRLCHFFYSS